MDGWVFLSGMMGSGKSTVGRLLAEQLGAPFVDLDARIAEREGASIEALFSSRGEAAFRRLEVEEAERLLASGPPSVVALGGGTVTDEATRRRLLGEGVLITLTAPVGELAARLERTHGRPLLARGEAAEVLAELLARRADAYAECHGAVDTAARPPAAIAAEVSAIASARPIAVALGRRTYNVDIGRGLLATLPERLARLAPGAVVLVTDENVRDAVGTDDLRARIAAALGGRAVTSIALAPGEQHKTLTAVERIWDVALEAAADRQALVLAIGGGVVGDLGGFAASTLLRGVRFAQVPTSLLAMVDASVGGKTGFDRPQGKNLIGSFHQPSFVLCDIETLSTLPRAELRSGLAEVVKSAWIQGEGAVRQLEEDAERLVARDPDALERAVRMSVRLKAEIVASDEHESGRRMVLNLGHTVGHAIEAARGYVGIRHGEAVALGMIAAQRVAAALGRADPGGLERITHLLDALGLPTALDAHLDAETLRFVSHDKKRSGGKVRFVVPHEPGRVTIVPLEPAELAAALGV